MHHWGKVMNDDLAAIAGKYEELVGRLQEKYGIAKEEANQQIRDFKRTIGKLKWAGLVPDGFPNYSARTWGPASAERLIAQDGRNWMQLAMRPRQVGFRCSATATSHALHNTGTNA